jgi:hypothetical protein
MKDLTLVAKFINVMNLTVKNNLLRNHILKYFIFYQETHLKTHIGEKTFICRFERCSKSFYDRGNLKYHQKKFHSEELEKFPLSCIHTKCNFRFQNETDKLQHHYITDPSCFQDSNNILNLLSKFKKSFLEIKFDKNNLNTNLVNSLEKNYNSTFQKLSDKQNFLKYMGKKFNEI